MSDLIKKIKIKKQDGSFTDYIPIGAEAGNVNVDDESVATKLNKTPYYYNSVADMKADTKLKAGDMAITLGYYEANDGGGAEYKIVSDNSLTSNDVTIHTLSNTLKAKLLWDNVLNIKQAGAKGDGTTVDTSAFEKAIAAMKNADTLYIPIGKYVIDETITIEKRINLLGATAETFAMTGSTIYYTGHSIGILYTGNQTTRLVGIKISNLIFSGDNQSGEALLKILWTQFATVIENAFMNFKGSGVKIGATFESQFNSNMFRKLGSEENGAFHCMDYLVSSENNTNNIHFENNTMGLNAGYWIKFSDDARSDGIWITNNKIEYDDLYYENTNEMALMYFGYVNRIWIHNNELTYFSYEDNKYASYIKIKRNVGIMSIKNNYIIQKTLTNREVTTYFIKLIGNNTGTIDTEGNVVWNWNSGFQDMDTSENTGTTSFKGEPLLRMTSDGNWRSKRDTFFNDYVEATSFIGPQQLAKKYDSSSLNEIKMVLRGQNTQVFTDIPVSRYIDLNPSKIILKIRAKKETASNTTMNLMVRLFYNGSPQVVVKTLRIPINNTGEWAWYTAEFTSTDFVKDGTYGDQIRFYVEDPTSSNEYIDIDGYIINYTI